MADEGAVRVLLESKFAFDVVDLESDLDALPAGHPARHHCRRSATCKQKLERLCRAGRPRAADRRERHRQRRRRHSCSMSVRNGSEPRKTPAATTCCRSNRCAPASSTIRCSCIAPAEKIRVTDGTSLGEVFEPYFDRAPRHFSGHVNAASKPDASGFAAGVQKGGFTYLSFPIFSCYLRSVRSPCSKSPRN